MQINISCFENKRSSLSKKKKMRGSLWEIEIKKKIEEMAQSVKCLLPKYEDFALISGKKPTNPSTGKVQTGRAGRLAGQSVKPNQ